MYLISRLLLLLPIFLLLGCHTRGEQEIIIVPKGYSGYILILFNQKSGIAPKYVGEKRVYEVPSNGILKTQFAGNYGWREFPEYYYDKIAPENKLSSYALITKAPKDTIVGFMGSSGTVKKKAGDKEWIEFMEFYVGTNDQIKQAQEQIDKFDIGKNAED